MVLNNSAHYSSNSLHHALVSLHGQSGILSSENENGKHCLHISNHIVCAFFSNGRPVLENEKAREMLYQNMILPLAGSKFQPCFPGDLRQGHEFLVIDLLAQPQPFSNEKKGLISRVLTKFGI